MRVPFTCPNCGHLTHVAEHYLGRTGPCKNCGQIVTIGQPVHADDADDAVSEAIGDDATMRLLLPVGRSGWAIAAGYAGLFSVLLFPAPVAVILGILAIRDIKKHPDKHGLGRAVFGLGMGAACSILLIIGIASLALG